MIYLVRQSNPTFAIEVETQEEADTLMNPVPYEDGTADEAYVLSTQEVFDTRDMSPEDRAAANEAKAVADKAANDAAEQAAVDEANAVNAEAEVAAAEEAAEEVVTEQVTSTETH